MRRTLLFHHHQRHPLEAIEYARHAIQDSLPLVTLGSVVVDVVERRADRCFLCDLSVQWNFIMLTHALSFLFLLFVVFWWPSLLWQLPESVSKWKSIENSINGIKSTYRQTNSSRKPSETIGKQLPCTTENASGCNANLFQTCQCGLDRCGSGTWS